MIALAGFTQSAVNPAGPQSANIYSLWHVYLWICIVVWVLVMAFLIAGLTRRRRNRPQTPESNLRKGVVAATVITIGVLFFMLVASIQTGNALSTRSFRNPLSIEIIGHQWWWEVHYQFSQPNQEVVTANEIHIPVGRAVIVKTTSHDVIHSVWIPNLDGKIDAIPEHVNTVWLRADKPGTYRGQCAEFCGMQHAHMAMLVFAEPEAKFQKWLDDQRSAATAGASPVVARGRQVFEHAPCVLCHTIRGTSAAGTTGPDLTHLASRTTLAAGTMPNTPGNLAGWITDSQRVKPGNNMPPINVPSEDLQPLLSFLESLR